MATLQPSAIGIPSGWGGGINYVWGIGMANGYPSSLIGKGSPGGYWSGAPTGISKGYNSYEVEDYDEKNLELRSGTNGTELWLNAKKLSSPIAGYGQNGWPSSVNYTSAAFGTAIGSGPTFCSTGLHAKAGATPILGQIGVNFPGTAADTGSSPFDAIWMTTPPYNWFTEYDMQEALNGSSRLRQTTDHYDAAGTGSGSAGTNSISSGTWSTQPPRGTWVDFTWLIDTDGSLAVWVDGTLVSDLGAINHQNSWLCFIVDYALDTAPPAGWPGDGLGVRYAWIGQPVNIAAGTGIVGGGIDSGASFPGQTTTGGGTTGGGTTGGGTTGGGSSSGSTGTPTISGLQSHSDKFLAAGSGPSTATIKFNADGTTKTTAGNTLLVFLGGYTGTAATNFTVNVPSGWTNLGVVNNVAGVPYGSLWALPAAAATASIQVGISGQGGGNQYFTYLAQEVAGTTAPYDWTITPITSTSTAHLVLTGTTAAKGDAVFAAVIASEAVSNAQADTISTTTTGWSTAVKRDTTTGWTADGTRPAAMFLTVPADTTTPTITLDFTASGSAANQAVAGFMVALPAALVTPPADPVAPTLTLGAGNTSYVVTWGTLPTGADHAVVYAADETTVVADNQTGTSWTSPTVIKGTYGPFYVEFVGTGGTSNKVEVTPTTVETDAVIPAAPAAPVATLEADNETVSVSVTIEAGSDSYSVLRAAVTDGVAGTFATFTGSTGLTSDTFIDTPGVGDWQYQVEMVNTAGTSAASPSSNIINVPTPPTTPTGTTTAYYDLTRAYQVQPSTVYTVTTECQADVYGRPFWIAVNWYDASDTLIQTDDTTSATDKPSAPVALFDQVTSPSNAAIARLTLKAGPATTSESHSFDKVGLMPGVATKWSPGGTIGTATVQVFYTDANTPTPTLLRNGTGTVAEPYGQTTFTDLEAPFGVPRQYSATETVVIGGQTLTSKSVPQTAGQGNPTPVDTATIPAQKTWWLSDPQDPSTPAMSFNRLRSTGSGNTGGAPTSVSFQSTEQMALLYPFGMGSPSDERGTIQTDVFQLTMLLSQDQYDRLEAFRKKQRTLLLRSEKAGLWYVILGPVRDTSELSDVDRVNNPTYAVTMTATVVDRPNT